MYVMVKKKLSYVIPHFHWCPMSTKSLEWVALPLILALCFLRCKVCGTHCPDVPSHRNLSGTSDSLSIFLSWLLWSNMLFSLHRGLAHLPHFLSYFFPWTLGYLCPASHRAFCQLYLPYLSPGELCQSSWWETRFGEKIPASLLHA